MKIGNIQVILKNVCESWREYNQNIEQELLKAEDKSLIMKWWDILNYLAR